MFKKAIPTAMILLSVSATCVAENEEAKIGFFAGGGINSVKFARDLPDPDNYFLQLGYGFTENWSAELQYSDSYNEGSSSQVMTSFIPETGSMFNINMDLETTHKVLSAFLAYRSSGDFYWKAKAGFMDSDTTFTAHGSTTHEGEVIRKHGSSSWSESGWAAGIGAGYGFASSSIELEYITSDDEIDSVALGYNYWF